MDIRCIYFCHLLVFPLTELAWSLSCHRALQSWASNGPTMSGCSWTGPEEQPQTSCWGIGRAAMDATFWLERKRRTEASFTILIHSCWYLVDPRVTKCIIKLNLSQRSERAICKCLSHCMIRSFDLYIYLQVKLHSPTDLPAGQYYFSSTVRK